MREYRFLLLSIVLAVGFFLGDLLIPMDIAGGVLYVVAVLVTMWTPHRRLTGVVALLATIFLFVGYAVGPSTVGVWVDVSNRILGLLAVWLTAALVGERRRVEDELRQSESKIRSILNATADAIISLDSDDRIETFNPATSEIFGSSSNDLHQRPILDLADGSSTGELAEYLQAVRQARTNADGIEIVGRRIDGSTFPMHVTLTSSHIDGQRQITGVLRDMSQQRLIEQEMMRITELERRRIGHQLHEGLGQMLTGIGLITRSLHQKLRAEEHPSADEAAHIIGFLQEADEHARDLSLGLVPLHQDETGLSYALQRFASNAYDRFGVECVYRQRGIPISFEDPITAAHLYQIVQEAVTSLVAAAEPRHVAIELIGSEKEARITIEDDGTEHPHDDSRGDDLPWENVLSYSARLIGATLKATRDESGGHLTCTVPLADGALRRHSASATTR